MAGGPGMSTPGGGGSPLNGIDPKVPSVGSVPGFSNAVGAYEKGGFVKGHKTVHAEYASGGPALGRERDFMKEPDPFRQDAKRDVATEKTSAEAAPKQDYGGAENDKPHGRDKSLKTIKPRT
jgi:hypothetical protein